MRKLIAIIYLMSVTVISLPAEAFLGGATRACKEAVEIYRAERSQENFQSMKEAIFAVYDVDLSDPERPMCWHTGILLQYCHPNSGICPDDLIEPYQCTVECYRAGDGSAED